MKTLNYYQTFGGLYAYVNKEEVNELTILQKIQILLVEVLKIIAELFNSNYNDLVSKILKLDEKNNKTINLLETSAYNVAQQI